ncbi:MAG: hypothetical protein KDC80_04525, partial [Saprospiraceae bacterium]|nr:hypothetical protein [Saprospiraceae bacterium]
MKALISKMNTFLLVVALFSLTGCKIGKWIENLLNSIVENERKSVEQFISEAQIDIIANVENWERILNDLKNDIPDLEKEVKQDIDELIQRSVSHVGIEVKCEISYMGDMIFQGLEQIKASFLGQVPTAVKGMICDISPDAIDMALAPNDRNKVTITGYNLDKTGFKMYHISHDGTKTDVTSNLTVTSPFKLIANLGSSGIVIGKNSKKLQVVVDNGLARVMQIIGIFNGICEEEDRSLDSKRITIKPELVRGDREFKGHGPCTFVNLSLY